MDRIKVERSIDGLTEWRKHVQTNSDIDRDISTAIEALKAQLLGGDATSALNNQVNLCDSCTYTYPECPSEKDDVIFGNGIGNDNICACNKYQPTVQPSQNKYEYHYDHTDCIWYRPEARNRCPATCAQYRDGWNDAMNYIFRDGEGYRPFRRDKKYEG